MRYITVKIRSFTAFGIVSSILFALPVAAMVSSYAGDGAFMPTLISVYGIAGVLMLTSAIREFKENKKNDN